jgi:hypothetical protein
MTRSRPQACPPWCVADHTVEDEPGAVRHRGATVVVPGIAVRGTPPHDVHGVELLIELHSDAADPVVAVYIGDGTEGIDITTETAGRLVRRLIETLREAGAAAI